MYLPPCKRWAWYQTPIAYDLLEPWRTTADRGFPAIRQYDYDVKWVEWPVRRGKRILYKKGVSNVLCELKEGNPMAYLCLLKAMCFEKVKIRVYDWERLGRGGRSYNT